MASDRNMDHEGLAHALVISLGGKSKAAGEDGEGSDQDKDLRTASDAVFDAVKADDRDAFADALKSYVQLCGMSYGEDEDDDQRG